MRKLLYSLLSVICFISVCIGGYSIYRLYAIQTSYAEARNDYIEIQEEYKTMKPRWD